jgi:8-oxo-dGTP pyrophosphatase MutT (NUDIX family)
MNTRWKPSATVAAVIAREAGGITEFLLVEEHTPEGLRLNNPAGHLDPGESPVEGCAREALEETAFHFRPTALVGVYLSRFQRELADGRDDITYLRFAFCGELGDFVAGQALDEGIVRTVWLTAHEIRGCVERHRSPLLLKCMEDYLAGQRFSLGLVTTTIPRSAMASGGIDPYAGDPDLRRNDPCPCGSGRKYKHCHGAF